MKNILIGVTGSISAYKSADIVSKLNKNENYNLDVILTKNACKFITPLTFETLCKNKAITNMFDENHDYKNVEHISLSKKADIVLIAPASANIIAKIAHGIADDMLSTTILAMPDISKLVIAPAMNTNMLNAFSTKENIAKLKSVGVTFIDSSNGILACGDVGDGKLAATDHIVDFVDNFLSPAEKDFEGKRILITAGPTIESIDPVRYITNHSSGKMGYALAEAAAKRGAEVTLISGKTNLNVPNNIKRFIPILSAADLYDEVLKNFTVSDIVIQSAAVADYTPITYSNQKIKKSDDDLKIELKRTKDIAYEIGKLKTNQILIGFAAETNDLLDNAVKKMMKKNLDMIIANDLTNQDAGFASDTNVIKIVKKNGDIIDYETMTKLETANKILDHIEL